MVEYAYQITRMEDSLANVGPASLESFAPPKKVSIMIVLVLSLPDWGAIIA